MAAVRVLITGASGFAGGYLARACAQAGDDVLGISRTGAPALEGGEARAVDLLDGAAVDATLARARPQVVYHLAALSSVGLSWSEPARTIQENVSGSVNLLEALRTRTPGARVVWVSSCEVYGAPAQLPVTEEAPVTPANPYAVSKATGDLLAGVYAAAHGLDIIRVRPFSHAGPGQRPIFILSSLAQQGAAGRLAGRRHLEIVTGNAATRRDFTDVRDVVRAYRLLALQAPAGVYNVSSGRSISAAEQVSVLADLLAPITVEHRVDPARIRANEVTDLRGSHARLTAATGWEPQIDFRQTMADTLAWWERELRGNSSPARVRH